MSAPAPAAAAAVTVTRRPSIMSLSRASSASSVHSRSPSRTRTPASDADIAAIPGALSQVQISSFVRRRGSGDVTYRAPHIASLRATENDVVPTPRAQPFPIRSFARPAEPSASEPSSYDDDDDDDDSTPPSPRMFDPSGFSRRLHSIADGQVKRWEQLLSKPWHARSVHELAELDATCTAHVAALASMPAAVRQDMLRHGTLTRMEPGSTLFEQGDPGDAVYVLLSGWVMVRVSADSTRFALRSIDPRDLRKRANFSGALRGSASVPRSKKLHHDDPTIVNTAGPLEAFGDRALQQLFIDLLLRSETDSPYTGDGDGGGGGGGSSAGGGSSRMPEGTAAAVAAPNSSRSDAGSVDEPAASPVATARNDGGAPAQGPGVATAPAAVKPPMSTPFERATALLASEAFMKGGSLSTLMGSSDAAAAVAQAPATLAERVEHVARQLHRAVSFRPAQVQLVAALGGDELVDITEALDSGGPGSVAAPSTGADGDTASTSSDRGRGGSDADATGAEAAAAGGAGGGKPVVHPASLPGFRRLASLTGINEVADEDDVGDGGDEGEGGGSDGDSSSSEGCEARGLVAGGGSFAASRTASPRTARGAASGVGDGALSVASRSVSGWSSHRLNARRSEPDLTPSLIRRTRSSLRLAAGSAAVKAGGSGAASAAAPQASRAAVVARVDEFVALLRRIVGSNDGADGRSLTTAAAVDWRGMAWKARADVLPDRVVRRPLAAGGAGAGAGGGDAAEQRAHEDGEAQELLARLLYGDAAVDAVLLSRQEGAASAGAAAAGIAAAAAAGGDASVSALMRPPAANPPLFVAGGIRMASIVAPVDVQCLALRVPALVYLCALARTRCQTRREAVDVLQHTEPFRLWPRDALLRVAATAQRRTYRPGETLAKQGERAQGMFALLLGHARVMRAVAVPSSVRAAALKKLQPSPSQGNVDAAPGLGQSAAARPPKSRVISVKTNVRGASHITLLEAAAASAARPPAGSPPPTSSNTARGRPLRSPRVGEQTASPRSPRSGPPPTGSAHTSSQASLSTLGASASTEDLVANLMSWVSARQTGTLQGPAPVQTPPEHAVEATRSLLLLDSTASVPSPAPASSDAPTGSPPRPLRRAGSVRGLSSSHPLPGEETVLIDLRGLRRYDTWGFCDCVLGSGVDVRQENSIGGFASPGGASPRAPVMPSPQKPEAVRSLPSTRSAASIVDGSSAAVVSRAARMQQQASVGGFKPGGGSSELTATGSLSVLDPPFEPRYSPLHSLLFSHVDNTPWSLAVGPQTSDLFARSHVHCESLVAETWVEALYIPRDGVDGLLEICSADLAVAEASWSAAILAVPTYAQVLRDLLRSVQWMGYRATVRDESVRDVAVRRAEKAPGGAASAHDSSFKVGLPEPFVHTSVKDTASAAAFARASAATLPSPAASMAASSSSASVGVGGSASPLRQPLPSVADDMLEAQQQLLHKQRSSSAAWLSERGASVYSDTQRIHAVPRTARPLPPEYVLAEIAASAQARVSEDARLDAVLARNAAAEAERQRRAVRTGPATSLLQLGGGPERRLSGGGGGGPARRLSGSGGSGKPRSVSPLHVDIPDDAADTSAPRAAAEAAPGGGRREVVLGADALLGRHLAATEFSLLPTTGDALVQHMTDLAVSSAAAAEQGAAAYEQPTLAHNPALAAELASDARRRRRSVTLEAVPIDKPVVSNTPLLSLGFNAHRREEGSDAGFSLGLDRRAAPPLQPDGGVIADPHPQRQQPQVPRGARVAAEAGAQPGHAAFFADTPQASQASARGGRGASSSPRAASPRKASPRITSPRETSQHHNREAAAGGGGASSESVATTAAGGPAVPLRHLLKANATTSHIASMGLLSPDVIQRLQEHHERLQRSESWVVAAAGTHARGYFRPPPQQRRYSAEAAEAAMAAAAAAATGVDDEEEGRSPRVVTVASWPWSPTAAAAADAGGDADGSGKAARVTRIRIAKDGSGPQSSPLRSQPSAASASHFAFSLLLGDSGAATRLAGSGGATPTAAGIAASAGGGGPAAGGHGKSHKALLLRASPEEAYRAQVAQLLAEFGAPPPPPPQALVTTEPSAQGVHAPGLLRRRIQKARRASIEAERAETFALSLMPRAMAQSMKELHDTKALQASSERHLGGGAFVTGLRTVGLETKELPGAVTQLRLEALELPAALKGAGAQHTHHRTRPPPLPQQPSVASGSDSTDDDAAASAAAQAQRMRLPFHQVRLTDMVVHAPLDPAVGAILRKRRSAMALFAATAAESAATDAQAAGSVPPLHPVASGNPVLRKNGSSGGSSSSSSANHRGGEPPAHTRASPAAAGAAPRGKSNTPGSEQEGAGRGSSGAASPRASPRPSPRAASRAPAPQQLQQQPQQGQKQKPLQAAGVALVKARQLLQPPPHPLEEKMQLRLLLQQQQHAPKYSELSALARSAATATAAGATTASGAEVDVRGALQAIIGGKIDDADARPPKASPRAAAASAAAAERRALEAARAALYKNNPDAAAADLSARLEEALEAHASDALPPPPAATD